MPQMSSMLTTCTTKSSGIHAWSWVHERSVVDQPSAKNSMYCSNGDAENTLHMCTCECLVSGESKAKQDTGSIISTLRTLAVSMTGLETWAKESHAYRP